MTPRRSGLRILGYACVTATLTFTGVSALQAVVNPPLKQLEQLWPPQGGAPSAPPATSAAEEAGNSHMAPTPEGDSPAAQLPWWACDPSCHQPAATPSGHADGADAGPGSSRDDRSHEKSDVDPGLSSRENAGPTARPEPRAQDGDSAGKSAPPASGRDDRSTEEATRPDDEGVGRAPSGKPLPGQGSLGQGSQGQGSQGQPDSSR